MKVTDPVCGMSVESEKAAATETYQGRSYYFCSPGCRNSFKTDPGKFAAKAAQSGAGAGDGGHQHHG